MIEYMYRAQESPMSVDQLNSIYIHQGYELISIVYNKDTNRYAHYFKRHKDE